MTARLTATRSPWTTPSPRARAASEEAAAAVDSVVDLAAVGAAAGEDVAASAAAAASAAEEEEAPEVVDADGVAALEVQEFVLLIFAAFFKDKIGFEALFEPNVFN